MPQQKAISQQDSKKKAKMHVGLPFNSKTVLLAVRQKQKRIAEDGFDPSPSGL